MKVPTGPFSSSYDTSAAGRHESSSWPVYWAKKPCHKYLYVLLENSCSRDVTDKASNPHVLWDLTDLPFVLYVGSSTEYTKSLLGFWCLLQVAVWQCTNSMQAVAGLFEYHKLPTALAGEMENNISLIFLNEKTEKILDRLVCLLFLICQHSSTFSSNQLREDNLEREKSNLRE